MLPKTVHSLIYIYIVLYQLKNVYTDEESVYYPFEPKEYPNLMKSPKSCAGPIRNPPTAVCDPMNILNREEAKQIDNLIKENSNGTVCLCRPCKPNQNGLNIKIAIVETYKQEPNKTMAQSLEYFAEYTRSVWNVSPNCYNDVIVFISTVYNEICISRGIKAQHVLPTSVMKKIEEEATVRLKYNALFEALEYLVGALNEQTRSYDSRLDRFGLNNGISVIIIAGVVSLIVLIAIVYFAQRRESARRKRTTKQTSIPKYDKINKTEPKPDVCKVMFHDDE